MPVQRNDFLSPLNNKTLDIVCESGDGTVLSLIHYTNEAVAIKVAQGGDILTLCLRSTNGDDNTNLRALQSALTAILDIK